MCCFSQPVDYVAGTNIFARPAKAGGRAKKATKRSPDGHRVMCFADLIDHLGTLTRNIMRLSLRGAHRFTLHTTPTQLQQAAFRLLALEPSRVQ